MTQSIPNPGAVVSLSGGMDSATALAHAVALYGSRNVYAIGFNYGQRHKSELTKAALVAEHYNVPFQIIDLPRIFAGAGSSLMGDQSVEIIGSYEDLAARFGSQPTVVPNRNMNFIAQAVTFALTHNVGHVIMGAHAGDAANYHYPDCRPAFNGAMAAAIEVATEGAVQLDVPFNWMSKGQVVEEAFRLKAPLHLTQSCYNGQDPACGHCATCYERVNAFCEAGFIDPIPYAQDTREMYGTSWKTVAPYPMFK